MDSKVLLLIDVLGAGGKERQFAEMCCELGRHHPERYRIVILNDLVHYREILDCGIPVTVLPRTKGLIGTLKKIPMLWRICRTFSPSGIMSWSMISSLLVQPMRFARPTWLFDYSIRNSYGFQSLPFLPRLLYRCNFRFVNYVAANSRAGLKAYFPHGCACPSDVIYNGLDLARFDQPIDITAARAAWGMNWKYVVGMTGSFTKQKDYETFFRAASIICKQRDDVGFVAIGEGPDREEFQRRWRPELGTHLLFTGRINNIEDYVGCFDIGVLSSPSEGISNAIMEYMGMAKPVVAARVGGTPELVQENESGFLFPPGDAVELSRLLMVLLNDAGLRERMGKLGRSNIRQSHTITEMVAGIVRRFDELNAVARRKRDIPCKDNAQ